MLTLVLVSVAVAVVTRWLVRAPLVEQVEDLRAARKRAEIARRDAEDGQRALAAKLNNQDAALVHARDQQGAAEEHVARMHGELCCLAERLDQGAHRLAARQLRSVLVDYAQEAARR